jgi:chromosome segregation ATPase
MTASDNRRASICTNKMAKVGDDMEKKYEALRVKYQIELDSKKKLQSEAAGLSAQRKIMEKEIDDLQREMKILRSKNAAFEDIHEKQTAYLKRVDEMIKEKDEHYSRLQEQLDNEKKAQNLLVQSQLTNVMSQIDSFKADHDKIVAENAKLRSFIDSMQSQAVVTDEKNQKILESYHKDKESALNLATDVIKKLEASQSTEIGLRKDMAELQKNLTTSVEQLKQTLGLVEAYRTELETLKKSYKASTTKLQKYEKNIELISSENQSLKKQNLTLSNLCRTLQQQKKNSSLESAVSSLRVTSDEESQKETSEHQPLPTEALD